ncbi:conserved oligomeric Golgi complex subunit 2-like [Centruroides sculpturatus]|uniref:conserved oligomeric Golgi complex subunit 2-like n=1 Tax=Centruroides sculpturatus TaxID=218467 RepID=UPI000C6EF408|nr:conserved oligomeric Golgi complex subunit 2-like [Centruroides sculpturatus]
MALKEQIVPKEDSSSLCFQKSEFAKDDFCVDYFVSEYRKHVPLEVLRDDLGIYLNVLRSSMIELINKDYADFVNLSSNLVGLDKSINNLTVPLGQLREEVMTVKTALDDALDSIQKKLQEREETRNKKILIQKVMIVLKEIEKIEMLLNITYTNQNAYFIQSEMRKWSSDLVERVALNLVEMQFILSKLKGLKVIENLRIRMQKITSILRSHLEEVFINKGLFDPPTLEMVLRTYAIFDKTEELELLFCKRVVRPHLEKIITEKNLQQNGLNSLYKEILDFLINKCKIIFEVTTKTKRTNLLKGYDFVGNVIWPEIASQLIHLTPSIFAPGNPNLFHQHYSITLTFLEDFERTCSSHTSIRNLRQYPSYKSFMEKWNLLVYFQIRFQEIGGAFEEALLLPFLQTKENLPFNFRISSSCWVSIQKCWSPDIYLPSLSYKFWKFTLQILSRYTKWITTILEKPVQDVMLIDNSIQHSSDKYTNSSSESQNMELPSVVDFVTLVNDIEILQKKVTEFFEKVIWEKISEYNDDLRGALECSLEELAKMPSEIGTYVIRGIVAQCSQHLKLVSDIPRLYRKTNREHKLR